MIYINVTKSRLIGQLCIPPSKSQTLRAILFGSLASGTTTIAHYLKSPDTSAMIAACRKLGALITVDDNLITIDGKINFNHSQTIEAGNSGIVLRFIAAIAAHGTKLFTIKGDHSKRPMNALLDGLSQLGVSCHSHNGYAPVTIKGPLLSGRAIIDGKDSQPVSALIIASCCAPRPIEIEVTNPGEIPWLKLTLSWLDRLSIPYSHKDFKTFRIEGNAHISGFDYCVPGDISSAAFPIAAALITNSPLTLKNIDLKDPQGDKLIISLLQKMGAHIETDGNSIRIEPGSTLKGISIDVNPCIDAITILAVIGCYAEGKTHLYNGAVARTKECDRIRCIAQELRKMGADIIEHDDGLTINGKSLHGAHVFSHHDQRVALSLAIAGLGASQSTIIEETACIAKTYSTFVKDFQDIGASIKESS